MSAVSGGGPRGAAPVSSVLFVCMGNICRSPTAEAVFRHLLTTAAPELQVQVDSAGTHAYHVGQPPDRRAQAAALRRGIDLTMLRARALVAADFAEFERILVMDERNLLDARAIAPPAGAARLRLLLDYAPELGLTEVPDPYYGGSADFELVLDLCTTAARGLLADLRAR
jgi:protein-tyrosine phosphatase